MIKELRFKSVLLKFSPLKHSALALMIKNREGLPPLLHLKQCVTEEEKYLIPSTCSAITMDEGGRKREGTEITSDSPEGKNLDQILPL